MYINIHTCSITHALSLTQVLGHHAGHTEELSDSIDVAVDGDLGLVHIAEWVEWLAAGRGRHVYLGTGERSFFSLQLCWLVDV